MRQARLVVVRVLGSNHGALTMISMCWVLNTLLNNRIRWVDTGQHLVRDSHDGTLPDVYSLENLEDANIVLLGRFPHLDGHAPDAVVAEFREALGDDVGIFVSPPLAEGDDPKDPSKLMGVGVHLLHYAGESEKADRLRAAIDRVLLEHPPHDTDLKLEPAAFADAVISRL
ncbi:MAG: hypothetical protein P8J32_07800 [bacterium]|jgi:hypothetical protein|nr:hypothetical protein [bacterium]